MFVSEKSLQVQIGPYFRQKELVLTDEHWLSQPPDAAWTCGLHVVVFPHQKSSLVKSDDVSPCALPYSAPVSHPDQRDSGRTAAWAPRLNLLTNERRQKVKKTSMQNEVSCMSKRGLALAIALAFVAGKAAAVSIETGNPDVSLRWDNGIRYNLGMRTESPDRRIATHPNYDESDAKFKSGDVVSNRVDLLTEIDFAYKKDIGFRVSASAWYDQAYRDDAIRSNSEVAAAGFPNSYSSNRYANYTKRYHAGASGEILDAFVFSNFDAGSVPVSVKLGRHSIYWGESLLTAGHGIASSQGPIDLIKALGNPGSQVKELFLPVSQASFQAGLTEELSIGAQYFFDWRPNRYPEGGTYLGLLDSLGEGPNALPVAPGFAFPRSRDLKPDGRGDFGVMARWSPQWLNGTAGFYYRKYDEKNPWLLLSGTAGAPAGYRLAYAQDLQLFGISLSKELGGISYGAEWSYRKNAALNSAPGDGGAIEGARGNTHHVVVNAMGLIGRTPLFDTASYLGEVAYSRLDRVTRNPALFSA
ncbi:DUF1302 domain-containing protein [Massilia cavernae]|nr:DUF1302 family protein [Massilia cavernae]